ncbi:prepilin peptidase [Paenibacillus alkalitolerans]|uniref:prepilin peptidase n=1 Tax=Paenibacillus alkalitolerans TaxID=2799335 RepID=UPI0018F413CC|nr:A24 family peptidase [Paenibacillus alkalitolerans]
MEHVVPFAIILGLFGLIIGSLLNAAAMRVLSQQPVAFPPPHCAHCNRSPALRDMIPLASYALLKGKCRYCGERICKSYPAAEAATAAAFIWIGAHFGPLRSEWIAGLLLVSVLIVITITDIKCMIIPDKVVFTGVAAALAVRVFLHPLPVWDYLAGAAIGFTALYVLAVVSRGGIGGGDIKLYLFIGLLLGIKLTILSLAAASILGTVYGVSIIIAGKHKRQPLPFGPFIAAGSFFAFLYGEQWLNSYLSLFVF